MINDNRISVASFGSGSRGNATLVSFGKTRLLIDNGYSCKELVSRMHARNINPDDISAVLVTHEHGDHFNGVPAFANKYEIPVWMNSGTSLHRNVAKLKNLKLFNSHQHFDLGDITVCPVAVPHDSREACQFVFQVNRRKIGLLTDLGHVTPFVSRQYRDCDILLLEFNHDPELLANSSYPASLKARVSGSYGHLSNMQASQFLEDSITHKLKFLVAMHLSKENNQRELVLKSIAQSNLDAQVEVLIADQDDGFNWISIAL